MPECGVAKPSARVKRVRTGVATPKTYRPEGLQMVYKVPDEVVVQIRSHQVSSRCCKINKHRRPVDEQGLTTVSHSACLIPCPVHLGGCAVIVRYRVEAHVLGVRDSGLELGHDMIDPLLEICPGGRKIRIGWGHRIGIVGCGTHVDVVNSQRGRNREGDNVVGGQEHRLGV